jgi:hypothetical protein
MADFAIWGCAIATALGSSAEEFLRAFNTNIDERNEEVLSTSPVAAAIIDLMREQENWKGSPTQLLTTLENKTDSRVVKSKHWPKAPHVLTRRLKEVRHNLDAIGICVSFDRKRRARVITITKGSEE